mgnify:CR=1 FL=1
MSWKDLIEPKDSRQEAVLPWLGKTYVMHGTMRFDIEGKKPTEVGWHKFALKTNRRAKLTEENACVPDGDFLRLKMLHRGYVVGDKLIEDSNPAIIETKDIGRAFATVHLLPEGTERFARILAGRLHDDQYVFVESLFPLRPDDAVRQVWEDEKTSIDDIPHVSPSLDTAFRFETWRRNEQQRLRAEAERRRVEEEKKAAEETKRADVARSLGDGAGRRAVATYDFETAARAALAVPGAVLLDWRHGRTPSEAIVRYRWLGRRFECVCDSRTLNIIDAGVCLQDNDHLFNLESLPGVIRQADEEDILHVFRHVD